jgi:DNA-binding CsgD family transcriptional regulator
MRSRTTSWRVFSEFLRRLYASRDVGEVSRQIATGIPALIPADISTYNAYSARQQRVDFVIEPAEAEFPECRERLARLLEEHPITSYFLRNPQGSAKRLSDFLSSRQLHDSAIYSEFYRIPRVEHVLAAHIATRPGAQMLVALCRRARDFTDGDRLLLDLIDPHLAQAYRNAEQQEELRTEMELLRRSMDQLEHAIVLARTDGSIRLQTTEARRLMQRYFGDSRRDADRLPPLLRSWLRQSEALANGTPPATARPFVAERGEARLFVRRLTCDWPALLIFEENLARPRPESLRKLGITSREAEVLSWAAAGKSDADIAQILRISFRTVKKHLEHVYTKLGVENRTAAAAVAHEAAQRPLG